ncbi:MAG: hypothetical protein CMB96_06135 [Flavobacteriaceae bacterium]|nr:hypothetical protein [Flavobacteriaceae bacterium]
MKKKTVRKNKHKSNFKHRKKTRRNTKNNTKNNTRIIKNIGLYDKPPELIIIDGFKILLLPIKNIGACYISCNIHGGFSHETPKTRGAIHLLEHVLTSAWNKCLDNVCSGITTKGIMHNAFTNIQYSGYYAVGNCKDINIILDYITSITLSPVITQTNIDIEKSAVRTELYNLMQTNIWNMYYAMNKALYKDKNIYESYNFESMLKNIDNLTLSTLQDAFMETHVPDCMIYTISGNFNRSSVISTLKRMIKNKKPACKTRCLSTQLYNSNCYKNQCAIHYVKNIKASGVYSMYLVFPTELLAHDDAYIYSTFLKHTFGGTMNGIFHKILRSKLKLVYSVKVESHTLLCGTIFVINTTVTHKNFLPTIIEIINILKLYSNIKLPNAELASIKNTYLTEFLLMCQTSPTALSKYYTHQYLAKARQRQKIKTIRQMYAEIVNISGSKLRNCIKEWFDFSKAVLIYSGQHEVRFSKKNPLTWENLLQKANK